MRETCKTRPEFATDLEPHKENMRKFFREESETHEVLGECYADCDARMLARSVHVEPVRYDYATGKKCWQQEYVVFDYKNRNPLTYEAKTYRIGNRVHE